MTHITSLSGQTVCITGSLTGYTRSEATALLRNLGCRVTKKVSRVTDILIIANTYETTEKNDPGKAVRHSNHEGKGTVADVKISQLKFQAHKRGRYIP